MGTTEEGGIRKGVGVPQGFVVGHDFGASMGDTHGEVPAFWSSASYASATFNYLESVTIWPSSSQVLIVNSSVARAFFLRKASSRLYFKDIYRDLLHDFLVFLPLQGDILH